MLWLITPWLIFSENLERVTFLSSVCCTDHCKSITLELNLSVWKHEVSFYFYSLRGHNTCFLLSMKVTLKWMLYRPSSSTSLNCLVSENIKYLHLSCCLAPSLYKKNKWQKKLCWSIIRFGSYQVCCGNLSWFCN